MRHSHRSSPRRRFHCSASHRRAEKPSGASVASQTATLAIQAITPARVNVLPPLSRYAARLSNSPIAASASRPAQASAQAARDIRICAAAGSGAGRPARARPSRRRAHQRARSRR